MTSWGFYGDGVTVKDIHAKGSAAKLDEIVYAHAEINVDHKVVPGDPWADHQFAFPAERSVDGVADVADQPVRGHINQLRKLKILHPHLKVHLGIGGPGREGKFSAAAATAATRAAFAASVVEWFRGSFSGVSAGAAKDIFTGVELDWEFPGSGDKANFAALVTELRRQFDVLETETGKHYELTAWAPANEQSAIHWDNAILKHFDYLRVQGYDLHGRWESKTNFSSALDTTDSSQTWWTCARAIAHWRSKGMPAKKLILSVPFYGHSWINVPNVNNGLWQQATAADTVTYKVAKPAAGTLYRRDGMGAWKYDAAGQSKRFTSVDDAQVMAMKAAWVNAQGLLGMTAWELSGDTADGELAAAIRAGLPARTV